MNQHFDRVTKNWILLSVCFLLMSFSGNLFAQQHFTPLKRGEYTIVEEENRFNPGAKISGSYEVIAADRKEGLLSGGAFGGKSYQDIFLGFQSKVNSNVSLNIKLGSKSPVVSEQDQAYETRNSSDMSGNENSDGLSVVLDEAYLEYNHNPNAQLRIGRQYLDIADRKGLIFEGEATAISQGCRIGTWCYSVGGARLGDAGASGVFWLQLDYPVYESGNLIPDPWGKKPTRQEKSFSVELFRVMYSGNDNPLAEYGGWTGENSGAHNTTDSGDPVYFDNDGIEYFGMNIIWNHYDFDLHFTWSNMGGKRDYFSYGDSGVTSLGKQAVSGNAYYLDMGYRLSKNWKSSLLMFSASGNTMDSDDDNIWDGSSNAYFEVKKGSFGDGDALIYFNGRNGIGDGHSVSNLSFYGLKSAFRSSEEFYAVDLDLYTFSRTNAVLINDKSETGKTIGTELDIKINWQMEERLFFRMYVAYFQPGDAYSTNDSIRPDNNPQDFSMIGISGQYTF